MVPACQPGRGHACVGRLRWLDAHVPFLSIDTRNPDAQLEFRSSLALAFDRVSATLDAVRGHAHVDMLPVGVGLFGARPNLRELWHASESSQDSSGSQSSAESCP